MKTIVMTAEQEVAFSLLAERCRVDSIDLVLSLSFALLDWAVTEKERGKEIASANIAAQEVTLLRLTLLDLIPPLTLVNPAPRFLLIQGDRKD